MMRKFLRNHSPKLRLAAGGIVLAVLSACGGGGGASIAIGSSPNTITGRVADGYINGAIVFWDCNDNLTLDIGEISTTSVASGIFTIPLATSVACKLRAEIPSTAIDEDTNLPIGKSMTLAAVDGHPEFISPLTTLAALGVTTEAELKAKFLGNSTLSITDDYIAASTAGIANHNAAKYVAVAIQAVGGNIKTNDVDVRMELLSNAFTKIPSDAWTGTTPVLQSALDDFWGKLPKLSTINPLSELPNSIEFILNESAFSSATDPRRAVVKKALDGLKLYPYVVVGSNIRWRALPDTVLASFGPALADKSLFPATQEETVIRDRIFVALHEAQAANAAALGNFNKAVGATFLKNSIDMSLTSVNSALTLIPAAGYVKNAVFFNTNLKKLKKASAISKQAVEKLGDFVQVIQECGSLSNDLTYLIVAPDLISISDLKDPAVNLTKCIAGMMGSEKVKAVIDGISQGTTVGTAARNWELVKVLKGLSDVVSISLDLAQLSVPAAMYNETFGMIISSINSVMEINLSADQQNLIFEAALKKLSADLNAVLAREGEILIAARLKPYITVLESPIVFTPGMAIAGLTSTFNITGTNLPAADHLDITFDGCANIQFVSQSATQHQFTCTPNVAGTLTAVIRTLPGTTPLGSFPVAVSTAPPATTFLVPANLIPGATFQVPANSTNCTFKASGTWSAGPNAPLASQTAAGDVTGNAVSLTTRGVPVPLAPIGSLVVKRSSTGIWEFVGASNSISVTSQELLQFMMNDATDGGYTDLNTGAVSVTWVCTSGLDIPAVNFVRGLNVALGTNGGTAINDGYGANTLLNGPPYTSMPNAAEWDFIVPTAGSYELVAIYATALSRPVTISFNGTVVFPNALAAITGGWYSSSRMTISQGFVDLPAGAVTMRVARGDVFPHIKGFILAPKIALINPGNSHRYEVIDCGNWTQCRDAAVAKGGNLVTIRSQAESDWIVANLLPSAKPNTGLWIGFTDAAQEGTWVWQSGEPTSYTNWNVATGEPNNGNGAGAENYGMIPNSAGWSGRWNDAPLTGITQAIVEYLQ